MTRYQTGGGEGRDVGGLDVTRRRWVALWCVAIALAPACSSGGGGQSAAAAAGALTIAAPIGPSSTSRAATTSPAAPAPREFTVVLAGDVLLHEGLWDQAADDAAATGRAEQDYRPMLDSLRPVIAEADLAICHLETPVAESAADAAGYPLFDAPPPIVPALSWAGFDLCTTASNHTLDQQFAGAVRTLDALDAAGIAHTGSYRTAEDARTPYIRDVQGVAVAVLSYTYGTNGQPLPADRPWAVDVLDTADPEVAAVQIRADARAARQAGAEVVLAAYHWGEEYGTEPSAAQSEIAELVLDTAEVDLLFGHHAHVVQPMDVIDGRWVVYGLGNMLADQSTPAEGVRDGITARFAFAERPDGTFAVTTAEYVPTYTTDDDVSGEVRLLDLQAALADPATDTVTRGVLEEALARIEADVDLLGARAEHGVRRATGAPGVGLGSTGAGARATTDVDAGALPPTG